jgi:hypothetical protein
MRKGIKTHSVSASNCSTVPRRISYAIHGSLSVSSHYNRAKEQEWSKDEDRSEAKEDAESERNGS